MIFWVLAKVLNGGKLSRGDHDPDQYQIDLGCVLRMKGPRVLEFETVITSTGRSALILSRQIFLTVSDTGFCQQNCSARQE